VSLDTTSQLSYVYWHPQTSQEEKGITPCEWTFNVRVNGRHRFSLKILICYFPKQASKIHWGWLLSYCKVVNY